MVLSLRTLWIATLLLLPSMALPLTVDADDSTNPELTPETQKLLDLVDGNASQKQMQAFQSLAQRPDWQLAVSALTDSIRKTPRGEHNNECLALMFIAMKHHETIVLDLDPLIALLRTKSFTNQQKSSQVLAVVSGRVDLYEGKVRKAVRALIPLTTSQRGRVVDGALGCLKRITREKTLGRNPEAWADYFQKKYGEQLTLTGSVYEILAVVRSQKSDDGKQLYTLNDGPAGSLGELKEQARAMQSMAKSRKLEMKLVVVIPDEVMNSMDLDRIRKESTAVTKELVELGFGDATISPESDVFHAPFEEGFPKSR